MECDGLIILQQLMDKLEGGEFIMALTVARLIWLRRNSQVFGGVFTPPLQLVQQAYVAIDNFQQANHSSASLAAVRDSLHQSWIKPSPGILKLN